MLSREDFANADHEGAVNAVIKGLAAQDSQTSRYFIHTSGDSILKYLDIERQIFGEATAKVFNDQDDLAEIRSFPDFAPHRPVEKLVFAASNLHHSIHTAIVCPPTIYGHGRGPGNRQSIQLPTLTRISLERKETIQVGRGEAYVSSIHVSDLSQLYLKLFGAAIAGGGFATWNEEGYYFAAAAEDQWGHVSKRIASEGHKQGLFVSDNVASISEQEANQVTKHGAELLGGNSRQRANRARTLLGWEPKDLSLFEGIADLVTIEAKKLGLIRGHAEKVSE